MKLDPEDIESFRVSNVFPFFSKLRTGIFHTTSLEGYEGIRDSGYIVANRGQFPCRYPQSKVYWGPSMGYVCLFDFESATEEQCILNHHNWTQFFADHEPATVLLKLDRKALTDLIPNSARPKLGTPQYKGAIAYVEAWSPTPIPFSAIETFTITIAAGPYGEINYWEEFPSEALSTFDRLVALIKQASASAEQGKET